MIYNCIMKLTIAYIVCLFFISNAAYAQQTHFSTRDARIAKCSNSIEGCNMKAVYIQWDTLTFAFTIDSIWDNGYTVRLGMSKPISDSRSLNIDPNQIKEVWQVPTENNGADNRVKSKPFIPVKNSKTATIFSYSTTTGQHGYIVVNRFKRVKFL